jgi:small subunit ribosomal protein S10
MHQASGEMDVNEKIKIRLEAYDHRILDKAALDIVETAKRTGAKVAGPVPIPTKIERFTVQRSPHIDKKSREQFELRTHIRVIEILEPTAKTNDVFSKVDVPAGVDITIKQTVR